MIVRPLTLISGMMFAFSGAYLFMVKHHSEMLDDQLSAVTEATRQDEQSIRVLQAQWALEADPSRLAALAAQFTGLQPMKPGQLTTLASLGGALPAPGSPVPGVNPADPVPAMPQLAQAAPAAPSPVATQPAAPAPAQVAQAQPAAAPVAKSAAPVQLAAATAPAPAAPKPAVKRAPAPERLASAEAEIRHVVRHNVRVPHEQTGSALYAAATPAPMPMPRTEPIGAQVMSVRAVASAAPAPAPMPIDDGGSVLGMAQGGGN